MASFIAEGHLATHLRRTRRLYAERLKNLQRILAEAFSDVLEPLPQDGGMHVVCELRAALTAGCSDRQLCSRAAEAGLALTPLSPHYVGNRARQGLLLGFTGADEGAMQSAAKQLKTAIVGPSRPRVLAG